MIEIQLTQNKVTIIDSKDAEFVLKYKWTAMFQGNTWYARRKVRSENGVQHTILLHRFLLNAQKGQLVDHKNGNGLDNRRENLRFATKSQNRTNSKHISTSLSGFRGVRKARQKNGWTARITVKGKCFHLGTFTSKEKAARAYDRKAKESHGEFACLNFPNKVG